MTITCINGVNKLSNDYDAFIIDAWGVLHDGVTLFDEAAECLVELKKSSKKIIILSNAARRSEVLAVEMDALGIKPEYYDHLVSSGELAWQAIRLRSQPSHIEWGRDCVFVGPARSRSLLEGLDVCEVSEVDEASFLLVAGVEHFTDRIEQYEELLQQACDRNLPMVCANSDRIAVRGGVPYLCGGALAIRYGEIGGKVFEFGKPLRPIYEECLGLMPNTLVSKILAIGDSFETDIPGAANMDIDSLFISDGIHADFFRQDSDPDTVAQGLIKTYQCSPQFMMKSLRW